MLEEVLERPLADTAQSLRRELEAALALLDETGLLEARGQLLQLRKRRRGVLADEVPHAVEIDLGERSRLRRPRQHLLELVELTQTLEHVCRLGQPEALAAAEGHPPVPLLAREGRPQVPAETVDLPREVHVAQQLVHEPLQLGPLAGRHRREHRRGGRHPLRQLLEQLVEVLRVAGEQVAVLLHELLEARVERLAGGSLLHHLVEGVEGVADVLALLGASRRRRSGDLVEVGLHDLLAQPLEELLEALAGLARGELVVLRARAHGPRGRSGSRPSSARRSPTTFSVTSWRRSSPDSSASCSSWSSASRSWSRISFSSFAMSS